MMRERGEQEANPKVGTRGKAGSSARAIGRSRATRLPVLVALGLVLAFFGMAFGQKKDSCVDCHSLLEGPLGEPVALTKSDVHGARGFSCVNCHGGDAGEDDPTLSMSPAKGFVGVPKPGAAPALCGKCHSDPEFMKRFDPSLRVDQEREFATSVHGKRLVSGDTKVATCTSCHGAHGIRAANDPSSPVHALNVAETCARCHASAEYMAGYEIPHDQYEKYKNSVHAKAVYEGQDFSAPSCNDCHGNHGAAPPGVASVANVCGQCHVRQSSLFQASPHKAVFDAMGLGECAECHGNHEITAASEEMIGVGEKSLCINCHVEGDNGYLAAEKMRGSMDRLDSRINEAVSILDQAERAGMEVSRPKFELSEARDALTHARVLIHALSPGEVEGVITPGLAVADRSYSAGEAALAELSFRRKGLGVSLFFILFLAALIYLKIRQVEARRNKTL